MKTRLQNLLFSLFLPLLPKRLASRCLGRLERLQRPRGLVLWAIHRFAKHFRINMDEAEKPLSAYHSVNDLFTRRLKPEARPIRGEWVHPVDGQLTESEIIQSGQLIQAKGWMYDLESFLANGDSPYEGGRFLTYYLCPTDYHRVHAPVKCQVLRIRHVVGQLWPVNGWSVHHVKNLFCQNERLIFDLETQTGPMTLVMVGATNVGQMRVTFDPSIRTNIQGTRQGHIFETIYETPVPLNPGDELGLFEMGSTVILILNPKTAQTIKIPPSPHPVQMGEPLSSQINPPNQ